MKYRLDKYGNKLSVLGFGCMRFKNNLGKIDFNATEKQVLYAIENGVNYFDTAYIYPNSEATLGEILHKNGIRDKVYIATKLPHYLVKSYNDLDRIFYEELKRLKTDHIDYYLMHMLTDTDTWARLCSLNIEQWINEKKSSGAIKQIGFSYHGNSLEFCNLIDVYAWDFCMIQYNYMDESSQAGVKGLKYAASKGLPVMVMEPLRGGKLVNNLPDEAKKIFADNAKSYTPAQWAFKWLFNQKEVSVVLSGMNTEEMVTDNIKTACETEVGELTNDDQKMLKNIVKVINSKMKVGCTGCGYCVPCPKGVDIPGSFAAYNRKYSEGKFWALVDYFMCTALRKKSTAASNCIKCGKCEKHCPQGIKISEELKNVTKEFEGPVYKIAKRVAKLFKF
ncbi:MAG: aldo/keto reductase [Clostridiales bacterium]|nr:aldo/keto reductase [Clostridiales bacterium]